MTVTVTARRRVALAGLVTDAVTSRAFGDAVVSIVDSPPAFRHWLAIYATRFGSAWDAMGERPDRTRSRADGLFYFLDLPDGDYGLHIVAPSYGRRYGSATQTVRVAGRSQGKYQLDWAHVSLPPTTIEGCITSKKINISFAQVRLQGSGESTFSDVAGRYTIAGVEPGKRMLLVQAQGYKPGAQPVTIAHPGEVQTVNFNLLHNVG